MKTEEAQEAIGTKGPINGGIVATPCLRPALFVPLAEGENDSPFTSGGRTGRGHEVTSACLCPRKQDKGTMAIAHGGRGYRLTLGTQMAHDSELRVSRSSDIQTLASGVRITRFATL